MNRFLNLLVHKLLHALTARRGVSLAVLVFVGALAGWGSQYGHRNVGATTTAGAPPGSYSLAGRVVQVTDGDTFSLLVNGRELRIRLASIDAPETGNSKNQRPGQPYAQASRKALAALIAGKSITAQCHEQDHYERHICDVPLPDGTTANRQLVQKGMAWANMEKRGKFLRDASLPAVQEQARAAGLGIWQQPEAVAPWVWRYQCWQKQQC